VGDVIRDGEGNVKEVALPVLRLVFQGQPLGFREAVGDAVLGGDAEDDVKVVHEVSRVWGIEADPEPRGSLGD